MHRPRRVWLSDQERRALRAIEEGIATTDPELARTLDGSDRPPRRPWRRSVVVLLAFLALGLLVADVVLQTGGAMLLLVVPLAVLWYVVVRARAG